MLNLKIFMSSPGDVAEERRLAVETVRALEDSHLLRDRVNLRLVAWDDPAASTPMDARETPQASVNRWSARPAECDLTVVVLWSRLGTPLPAGLQRADGSRYASGTVWELEDAAAAGKPVFVYRRTDKPRIELDDADLEARRAQYDAVRRWFDSLRDADGALRAGVNEYATPAQFQQLLRQHLEAFIGRALATAATPPTVASAAPSAVPASVSTVPTAPAATPRRWIIGGATAAALAGVATVLVLTWGTGPNVDPVREPGTRASAAATASRGDARAQVGRPATLPQVRLAGPAEVSFSKIRASTYTVLALTPQESDAGHWRLQARIRLTTAPNSGGMNFWDTSFRLLVDGVPRAPDTRLNELVDSGASKDGELAWELPFGLRSLALRVHHYAESRDLPMAIDGMPTAAVAAPPAGPVRLTLETTPVVVFTRPTPSTFTVLSLSSEARRSGIFGLQARVRLEAPPGQAVNFWDDQFRLLVDGVPRAPDGKLNLVVDSASAMDAEIGFEVPMDAKTLVLRIQVAESAVADLPIRIDAKQ